MADNKLAPQSKNKLPWYEQALPMAGRATFLPFQDTATMNPNLAAQGRRMNLPARQAPGPFAEFAMQAASLDPQPDQGYGTMAAEMALGFVPGVGQAMAARDLERARRDNDPLGMGMAASSFVPFGKLINALRGRKQMGPVSELITYHGTPHRFPPTAKNPLGEFDPMKVGTGEGAQAYGVGAGYLAENPGVAKGYQKDVTRKLFDTNSILGWGEGRVKLNPGDSGMLFKYARGTLPPIEAAKKVKINAHSAGAYSDETIADAITKIREQTKGNLYKVDLPDEQIAKMLDWDKPLSQQTHLMNQTGPHGPDFTFKNLLERFGINPANTTGGQFLQEVGMGRGREKAAALSKTLSEYGIPGIRYLDQGSRAGGAGTSNFVVFDPKHMNIIGRE